MGDDVHEMFTRVAPRYDLANHVLSGGMHLLWKKRAAERSGAGPGDAILDCATGTGDLAFLFAQLVRQEGEVVGCDYNEAMLERARDKQDGRRLPADIEWSRQDIQNLTFAASRFDVASVAFGLRNVDDPPKAIAEMSRTVKSGGRVVVLEFGQPSGPIAPLYEFYSGTLLPRIGGLITGERDAYEYLHETASEFPCGEQFESMMRRAGSFDRVQTTPLFSGIAWLYVGSVGGAGTPGA